MRPVPAARSYGPHPLTIKQQLEAHGYAVLPSSIAYKRRITHSGIEVGHFTAGEACDLLPKTPPPTASAEAVLAEMARVIAAA